MYRDFREGEVVLIDKPFHWTSFDVVNKVRSVLKYKLRLGNVKTGHAGTLDPLATGLLILCTGKFTKRIEEFQEYEKEYVSTFVLGGTTASYDLESEVKEVGDYSSITLDQVEAAVNQLKEATEQVPPLFSARYVDGKRAYEYAREGLEVEMKSRPIRISQFEITRFALPEVDCRIVCSKGTYIRSLARDMGLLLGCGAYISSLCRTRIGPYSLNDALGLEEFEKYAWEAAQGDSDQ